MPQALIVKMHGNLRMSNVLKNLKVKNLKFSKNSKLRIKIDIGEIQNDRYTRTIKVNLNVFNAKVRYKFNLKSTEIFFQTERDEFLQYILNLYS